MSVVRRMARLAKELSVAQRAVDAFQLRAIYAAMPGLYEWLWDQAPPASGDQEIKGHDHSGSSADGGIPIPRNCILSVGAIELLQDDENPTGGGFMWEISTSSADGGFVPADKGYSPQRSTQIGYHWAPYVDVGLTGLFAEGWLWVWIDDPGADVDIRIYNQETASSSLVTTHPGLGSIQAVRIDEIPIVGGQQNRLTLQYSADYESPTVIRTYGLVISEIYKGGSAIGGTHASPLSQPSSTGATP